MSVRRNGGMRGERRWETHGEDCRDDESEVRETADAEAEVVDLVKGQRERLEPACPGEVS